MPPRHSTCANNLQISELSTGSLQLYQLHRKLSKLPSSNSMPFTLRPARLPNSHAHTEYSATRRKTFLGSQTGKSSEPRTDATRVRKSRQTPKRVRMGRTHRTGPSSHPQLHNLPSVCLRLPPLLLAVS